MQANAARNADQATPNNTVGTTTSCHLLENHPIISFTAATKIDTTTKNATKSKIVTNQPPDHLVLDFKN